MRRVSIIVVLLAVLIFSFISPKADLSDSQFREFHLKANTYEFSPSVITVNQGDVVRIYLEAEDITHGLRVDGYNINLVDYPRDEKINYMEFVANKAGTFTFRCDAVCGPMHPFMTGKLVVEPVKGMVGIIWLTGFVVMGTVGGIIINNRMKNNQEGTNGAVVKNPGIRPVKKFELTKLNWLKKILLSRWFQFWLILINTFFFVIILYAGFFGTQIGNRNFAVVAVWIVWWALLLIFLIPMGGRLWCTMCPLPAPGEWLGRGAFVGKGKDKSWLIALNKWPARFKNIWFQNIGFLLLALFSAVIITSPWMTSFILVVFILMALVFSLIYGRRVFCKYICPLGGFIGLYSLVSPLELRVKDVVTCDQHPEHECIRGSAKGYGCPWVEHPGSLKRNTYCGLCTECLKTCPKDNIAVNLKPLGTDLLVADGRKIDEAYKAIIMLTSAIFYSAIFYGSWGFLRNWASMSSMPEFLFYAIIFLSSNLIIIPFLYYLVIYIMKSALVGKLLSLEEFAKPINSAFNYVREYFNEIFEDNQSENAATGEEDQGIATEATLDRMFIDFSYVLVPIGLAAWIAFSITLLLTNGGYAISVISDPFGWGWNLFGTANYQWEPYFTSILPSVQVGFVWLGLSASIVVGDRIAEQYFLEGKNRIKSLIPLVTFLVAVSLIFIWLYF